MQRSGGELLLENTQHDGDAFFEAEKVTLTVTFAKDLTFHAGEVGRPSLQAEALLHNGGQDELDTQGFCFSASDPLIILIPTIGLQALANLSSHVAGRLAGFLLENPDLEAIHTVCVTWCYCNLFTQYVLAT